MDSATVWPQFAGELVTSGAGLSTVADDYGHTTSRLPAAVLRPATVEDVAAIVRFAGEQGLSVTARGTGHTANGQSQSDGGIVVDLRSLNRIRGIERQSRESTVDVDAGVLWDSLLEWTLPAGLTPPVLTDFLGMTVGGTLSVGGIGSTSSRHGAQVDQVRELTVVTGTGEIVRCSPWESSDLFEGALAGYGQCGIIVRATVVLVPAPQEVFLHTQFHTDLGDFLATQRRWVTDRGWHGVMGRAIPDPAGSGRWALKNVAVQFDGHRPPDAEPLSYADYSRRMAPDVELMRATGLWDVPHPRLDLMASDAGIETLAAEILASVSPAATGNGPILLVALPTGRFRMPLFRFPDGPLAWQVDILRNGLPGGPSIEESLVDNQRWADRNRELGGLDYPIGSTSLAGDGWMHHYGDQWPRLASAKHRYDPDGRLNPALGIPYPDI